MDAGGRHAAVLHRHGYTEVKKIGEGSFGQAVLVQSRDGSQAVCKMVDVSKASAKEAQEAAKEGRLLASLKHPFIVRYRENFTDGGWFCILMDYCRGGDLSQQIEKSKKSRAIIPEPQVLRWFTQALMALKYIHERHILHRDLKPGNFFLSKSGNLKMGDFGIAKVLSCTMACAKTQIGTPYYLSPEVCQEKPYTWGSDIWAMGCVLYELSALKVPFDAPNISGLVQKIVRGPIPVPYQHSSFIRELVAQILNRTPSARPSADDLLKRPQIQANVRQMLEEVQSHDKDGGEQRAESCEPHARHVEQRPESCEPHGRGQQVAHAAFHNGPSENFRQGDLVEYFSGTHGKWIPATVLRVDNSNGAITVDLKPNTWIPKDQQPSKVRRRKHSPKGRSPSPAARGQSPREAAQRSPSPAAHAGGIVVSARGPRRNARGGGA